MNRPEQFMLTTDYPTIKGNITGVATLTLNVPANFTIPAGFLNAWTTEANANIGDEGAMIRSTIKSSRDNVEYISHDIVEQIQDNNGYGYNLNIKVYRKSPTTATVVINVPNTDYPNYSARNVSTIAETITVKLSTFKSPFE